MFKRILCLGAHTDDCEVGCGGTLARFVLEEIEVYYATFSFAEDSLPKGLSSDTTRKEVMQAASKLGIKKDNVILFDYEVRKFPEYRQTILENLIKLKQRINPDLILTHNTLDTHQDHEVISQESFRAFKQSASILGYESFKNNRRFNSDIYICLDEHCLKTKLKAVKCFKSQIVKPNSGLGVIESAAKFRGTQIGEKYAECFENMRYIVR